MIDEKKLIEWLLGKKYITVDENSTELTEEFEKQHQWELSRNNFINATIRHIDEIENLSLETKISDWIPCSEALPNKEESTDVFVTYLDRLTGKKRVDKDCYFYGVWLNTLDFAEDRIAWMEIEPYKGDEK